MRVVLQRVARATVTVAGERVAQIGRGYLLLVGIGAHDPSEDPAGDPAAREARLADKIVHLRVFADPDGKMNLAIADVDAEVLVVSQFTLYADVRRGRRPSFTGAADPGTAAERVEAFARAIESHGVRVGRGVFGADMQIDLVNDGPVTLVLDADEL